MLHSFTADCCTGNAASSYQLSAVSFQLCGGGWRAWALLLSSLLCGEVEELPANGRGDLGAWNEGDGGCRLVAGLGWAGLEGLTVFRGAGTQGPGTDGGVGVRLVPGLQKQETGGTWLRATNIQNEKERHDVDEYRHHSSVAKAKS